MNRYSEYKPTGIQWLAKQYRNGLIVVWTTLK